MLRRYYPSLVIGPQKNSLRNEQGKNLIGLGLLNKMAGMLKAYDRFFPLTWVGFLKQGMKQCNVVMSHDFDHIKSISIA